MPIVEIPKSGDPLSQGDILKGIPLFGTTSEWSRAAAGVTKSVGCLVLSRPCNLVNKKQFAVAAIEAYEHAHPTAQLSTLNAFKVFNESIRDGDRTPDRFYLGQI